jgi:hypothetical protein
VVREIAAVAFAAVWSFVVASAWHRLRPDATGRGAVRYGVTVAVVLLLAPAVSGVVAAGVDAPRWARWVAVALPAAAFIAALLADEWRRNDARKRSAAG